MSIWDAIIEEKKKEPDDKSSECIQVGNACPICHKGILEYDGKLHLVCSECKTEFSHGFT